MYNDKKKYYILVQLYIIFNHSKQTNKQINKYFYIFWGVKIQT